MAGSRPHGVTLRGSAVDERGAVAAREAIAMLSTHEAFAETRVAVASRFGEQVHSLFPHLCAFFSYLLSRFFFFRDGDIAAFCIGISDRREHFSSD